ncbi:MAG: DmsE family decaheme c-type cytochrome [Gammaproteobacteria bacterium]|uniref:DmsE family decaheme c-type cytochrome n=1 Tax=Rhodoferax sp. TaxID=50421 RepID=UPI001805E9D0|nr:DmsE family decaheme c-type cytochrome [Rhodoferax sp.]MBU3900709.1 DmsE family decaheme c-type cytochrome [Gammaproteobacteria bacterium]MBA3056899.1 DmsE family decaheme c-type cytochrome [Rhodoferax sp.]MBU3997213.1 DmsE family decaheme c-type cytochrome [Gammaproteobacteria bacterium]MBU4079460.1 DmsE family decaheme c-type cytochrome [Gammaproteobacteria bacterium]MBU4115115.1 DmsE family decaheme c-type cytochrome [Gammaproteobacteria bacterium]
MNIKSALAVVSICLFGSFGSAWAADAQPTGAAFCVTCHDDEDLPDMSRSAHGFSADKRAPDCISCHGPSETHARKPAGVSVQPKPDVTFGKKSGKLSTVAANDRSRVCQTCHDKDAKRAMWSGSQHQAADVACDSCHQIHANRDKTLNKITQPETCYSCHKEQRSEMNKPSHHPVPEGKMTCSDCHNPHGSVGPKLVKRDSINDTCYTCHAEKRGPFVHPHDPVTQDCSTCHNSHGSMVPGLLKARAPILCQQCHTPHSAANVGSIASGTAGFNAVGMWQGRSCMNCHTQVHGSNNPSTTFPTPKTLMR